MTLHDDLACPSCDGRGEMLVEVVYKGDCSYEDVQDCDRCAGTGLRCSCLSRDECDWDCLVHGEPEPVEYVKAEDIEGGLPF